MVNLKLTTVAMIVVLQMCTANPISSKEENDAALSVEQNDLAKLFTEDELERAKSAGISNRHLVKAKSFGLTFDEIIQLHALNATPDKSAIERLNKVCEVLVLGHKMASNYTTAQEEELSNLVQVMPLMPNKEASSFFRTSVCGFLSQPHSLDAKLIPHTKIRYLKTVGEDDTGLERVKIAKRMCCVDEGGNIFDESKLHGLPDEEMKEFDEQWNNFDSTNVPESIKNLCDFFHAKNSMDGDQCLIPVVGDNKIHS